ncbi:hypothetical protein KM295_07890 [Natronomonas sp. F2-12]|jgi:hypothetical protein|uniref:CbaC protein n=1 Tax=Natronomonas aquatica TaxID=2841590 RepID=A0A9R1D5R8_9EURY|nr:hypothetical protein [Natronomonas aquatica]MCQ4333401.1 hypothetical protein [Natronomonas aquatica]
MRVSRAGLLVAIVIMVPIIVELRTVVVHLGFDVSLAETALFGAMMIGALVLWAMAPDIRGREPNGE